MEKRFQLTSPLSLKYFLLLVVPRYFLIAVACILMIVPPSVSLSNPFDLFFQKPMYLFDDVTVRLQELS